ncbi:MAG: TerB family tellurite resistance protein [Leptolyngbyaceae cyanobacterium MO_188.B28]|nr:TerB family tellurite resistance protein [Leptolyngbyaceae cyanobacterium MO_188.B28]
MLSPTQSPPSISPSQMNLLRIVTAMAWSDGSLDREEAALIINLLSSLFAKHPSQQQALRRELRDYLMQDIPLDELIPKLRNSEERELVMWLGYEVMRTSARSPAEANINQDEFKAYQKLLQLLDLSAEDSQSIETTVAVEVGCV